MSLLFQRILGEMLLHLFANLLFTFVPLVGHKMYFFFSAEKSVNSPKIQDGV